MCGKYQHIEDLIKGGLWERSLYWHLWQQRQRLQRHQGTKKGGGDACSGCKALLLEQKWQLQQKWKGFAESVLVRTSTSTCTAEALQNHPHPQSHTRIFK